MPEQHTAAYRPFQPNAERRVAGVLAAIKLGWEQTPDAMLADRAEIARKAQRAIVQLIEEALHDDS